MHLIRELHACKVFVLSGMVSALIVAVPGTWSLLFSLADLSTLSVCLSRL